jgi:hypothetical protein
MEESASEENGECGEEEYGARRQEGEEIVGCM